MTQPQIAERLYIIGYLTRVRPRRESLRRAVAAFQSDWGLVPDGIAGPQTVRALSDPLLGFCGVTEHVRTANGLCRWASPALTWTITGGLAPRISAADQRDAYAEAWGYWTSVCGIEATYTANSKTANVLMGAGAIDRGGNTLAWSELPCGSAPQLKQLYDTHETWVIAERPNRQQIDLVRVAAHEIGHVIGIPHLSDPGALLAPMYNPAVRRPQASDIAEARKRYGPPKEPAPPPPDEWTVVSLPVVGTVAYRAPSVGGGDFEVRIG